MRDQQLRFEFTSLTVEGAGPGLPRGTEYTAVLPEREVSGSELVDALRGLGVLSAENLTVGGQPLQKLTVGTWPLVNGCVICEPRFHRPPQPPALVLVALHGPHTGAVVQPAPGQTPFTDFDAAAQPGYLELTSEDLAEVTTERRVLFEGDTVQIGAVLWRVGFARSTELLLHPGELGAESSGGVEPGADGAELSGAGQILAHAVAGELTPRGTGTTPLQLSSGSTLPLQPGMGLVLQGPERHAALLNLLVQLAQAGQPALIYGNLADLPVAARFVANFRLRAGMDMAREDELAISVSADYLQQPSTILAYGAMTGIGVHQSQDLDRVDEADFERFARLLAPSVITEPADVGRSAGTGDAESRGERRSSRSATRPTSGGLIVLKTEDFLQDQAG